MSSHDQVIRRFRRQLMLTLTLRYSLALLAGWGFLWGTAVLVLRVAVGMEPGPLVWGLTGAIPAVMLGAELARRRLPTPAAVRALVDRRSAAGGLMMAEDETEVGSWRQRMSAANAPTIRWRGGRAWGLLLAASAFVLVGFFVPQRYMQVTTAQPLNIDSQTDRLAEQIDLLQEEQIIEEDRAADLREKLEQVRAEARADDPTRTWESLDHLEDTLGKSGEEAAEEALARTRELTEAQSLAEGLAEDRANDPSALDDAMTAEAMSHLSETLQRAAAENEQLRQMMASQGIDPAALGEMANPLANLTPEQMEQLRKIIEMSQAGKGSLKETMERLAEARMIDAEMLAECEAAGQCDGAGLAAFLAENGDSMSMASMMAAWCTSPGRGGVNRGRADAAMTWKDASDESGTEFEEQSLPRASLEAFRDSAQIGVSLGAPETAADVTPSQSGALDNAKAGGGSANRQTVLPRHRAAVERYFERE